MPRLEGEVFLFGTAMSGSLSVLAAAEPESQGQNAIGAGLIEDGSRQG
jgi:hypothetical protein